MTLDTLAMELDNILYILRVNYKKGKYLKDISFQYLIKEFGVIIYGYSPIFGDEVKQDIDPKFKGWRHIYISSEDDLLEAKESLVWNLARSGYLRYIRANYPGQYKTIIVEQLGDKIIRERLRLWNDEPMYSYFIEENKYALKVPKSQLLSYDPSFFDFIPEINK